MLTDICLEFVFCVWRVWFVRQQWVPIEANSSILVNFSLEKQKDIQNKKNIFFLQTLVNTSLKSVQNSWSNRLNDTVQITRYNEYSCLWKKKNHVHLTNSFYTNSAEIFSDVPRCSVQNVLLSYEHRSQRSYSCWTLI